MKEIVKFIDQNLNRGRLEEVSSSVIDAYKSGDRITIQSYAEALNLSGDGSIKKTFYSLIRMIHPDRLSAITADYKQARAESDLEKLGKIKQLLEVRRQAESVRQNRFEYQHTETWEAPSDSDFFDDHDADAELFEEDRADSGFIEAVKDVIFGNHDFHIEPADLRQIDGSLDIAYCGLEELDGIEYCINIRVLNITGNDISNLWDLQELAQLEELYASGNAIREIEMLAGLENLEILELFDNDIEDLTPLLGMNNLKFVDLRKNPLQSKGVIDELEASGVVVLH